MKLSELRPCSACNGPLIGPGKGPFFYVVKTSLAGGDRRAAAGVLGLATYFSGSAPEGIAAPGALGIAEVMAPDAEVIKVFGDQDRALWSELHVCSPCYMESPIVLWTETLNARRRKDEESGG